MREDIFLLPSGKQFVRCLIHTVHPSVSSVRRSLSQSAELLSHTETDKGGPLPSSVPMCLFDLGVNYANGN